MTFRQIAGGILLWGCLAGPALATDAPITAATPCVTLVKIFDTPVCRQELHPGSNASQMGSAPGQPASPFTPQVRKDDLERLKAVIWRRALIHKFGAAAVTPTDAELDDYRKQFNAAMAQSYLADKKTEAIAQALLDKNLYSPDNEKKLQGIVQATRLSVRFYEERQAHVASLPDNYKFVAESAEKQVALMMLTNWKQDKALYEAYHGQLSITAMGIEPIDAYAAFLKYIQQDGKLEIIDPAYKNVLKIVADEIDAPHTIVPAKSPLQAYFSSAAWEFKLSNNAEQLGILQQKLNLLPTLGPKPGVKIDEKDLIGKSSLPP